MQTVVHGEVTVRGWEGQPKFSGAKDGAGAAEKEPFPSLRAWAFGLYLRPERTGDRDGSDVRGRERSLDMGSKQKLLFVTG